MGALFSVEDANNLTALAKDRADSFGGKPRLRNQVYTMKLVKVESGLTSERAKQPNRQKVMMTYQDIKDEFEPVKEELVIEGSEDWIEGKRKRLAEQVVIGFGGVMKPAKDVDELVKNLNAFVNKPVRMAVQLEQRIWKKTKKLADGSEVEDWMPVEEPRVWYFGPLDKELNFNEAKSIIPLSDDMQEQWDEFCKRNPTLNRKFGKKSSKEASAEHAAQQIPPPEARKSAPTEATKAVTSDLELPDMAAPATTTQAPAKPDAADDDLPDMGAPAAQPVQSTAPAAAAASSDPLDFLNGPGQ